jgi:hypothetical protein
MMTEEREKYDVSQAQAAIEADRNARAARAAERIRAILDEERCQIVAQPQISGDGRIVATVQIVAI